jgi:hypothetical protein
MNIFKKGLLATATAVTLGIGAMGSAYAATYASAILTIDNFRLLRGGTTTALTSTDFTTLTGTNDAHATGGLNGMFAPTANSIPILSGLPLDLTRQCVGSCFPVPENNFTAHPPFGGTYGHADQFLRGAAIDIGATPAGVLAQTRADAATATNFNIASGNSDVGTSTTFRFALGADSTVDIAFNYDAFSEAQVTPGSSPTANANARISWSLNIVDVTTGLTVYTLSPGALNAESLRSATDANPGLPTPYSAVGSITDLTPTLIGGRLYQITIQHNTLANVLQEEVPEPATLAIVAAGLLSMSLISRRRRS